MKQRFIVPSNTPIGELGTTYNLPNYTGMLYTANRNTTLLNLIGGLNGGLYSRNKEYPTAQLYDLPASTQPNISEDNSAAGVTPTHIVRNQETNVVQIHQHSIDISYVKLANAGRLGGLNTNPAPDETVEDERAFQINQKLKIVANDMNYVMHNGVYLLAASSAEADKTRGMIAAITDLGGAIIDAGSDYLTKTMVDSLLKAMFTNGANFETMAFLASASVKVQLSNIYGFSPQDRNIGGINIKQIETDFGNIMVGLDRDVPDGTLVCYDLAPLSVVFQTVPNKGNLFYEELSKTGASEKGQLFGLIGFDHAPGFLAGLINDIQV